MSDERSPAELGLGFLLLRDGHAVPLAGISPQVRSALGRYPVRELITSSETYPLWVDRQRVAIAPTALGA